MVGIHFFQLSKTLFSDGIVSASFSDSLNGYLSTNWNSPEVFKTSDGGETFIDITPTGISENVHKIHAVSNNMAVAFSDIKILTTKNGGTTWSTSSYGPGNTYVPNDLYFKDTLNGMVGCYWNLMRETTNGGDTWTNRLFSTSQEHIYSISFPDPDYGFYSTGYKLYKTTNGGINWIFFRNLNPGFSKIKFIDRMTGIAIGDKLYYTTDGGLNWTGCSTINYYSDFDIKKNGEGSVLMALAYDYLYTSFDLGVTFNRELVAFDDLRYISMINPAKAFLYGFNGKIVQYHNPDIILNVQPENLPVSFNMKQNYPNPFNPKTTIEYDIPFETSVTLKIYDILGRETSTIVNTEQPAGNYKVQFDASTLASGIYFYRLQAGGFVETKKMVVLK